MGKCNMSVFEDRLEFARQYLPPAKGFGWRLARDDDDDEPIEAPTVSCFGIYVGHFVEVGLELPLNSLLLELMGRTGISFLRLAPNVVRIILCVSSLNKRLRLRLGMREILHCYRILPPTPGSDTYFFQRYRKGPELVKCLPVSQRGVAERLIVVEEGPVISEVDQGYEFPRPCLPQGRVF